MWFALTAGDQLRQSAAPIPTHRLNARRLRKKSFDEFMKRLTGECRRCSMKTLNGVKCGEMDVECSMQGFRISIAPSLKFQLHPMVFPSARVIEQDAG